jgi:phage shock protein A
VFERPIRMNDAAEGQVDPRALLQELRDIQDALRQVADEAGAATREKRQKERLYEHIRHTRSFE